MAKPSTRAIIAVPAIVLVLLLSFEGRSLDSAPWTFTYDPFRDNRDTTVEVSLCDGRSDWAYATPFVPFAFEQTVLNGSFGPTPPSGSPITPLARPPPPSPTRVVAR